MAISLCDKGEGLETFSTKLNGAVATLDAAGYGHELESSVALEGLASKLPSHLLTRWGRNVTRLFPKIPTLRDLNSWLGIELMGMKNVQNINPPTQTSATHSSTNAQFHYSNRNQQQGSISNWNRNSTQSYRATTNKPNSGFLPTVNAIAVEQNSSKCIVCNGEPGHSLDRCEKFLALSVDDRAKAVYDLENCFRCLGRNHFETARKHYVALQKTATAQHTTSLFTVRHEQRQPA